MFLKGASSPTHWRVGYTAQSSCCKTIITVLEPESSIWSAPKDAGGICIHIFGSKSMYMNLGRQATKD